MRPRIALCVSLSVLLLCMACGGANGFDTDESRMRSVSGPGFDSPHLHPVDGEAAGDSPTYTSAPSPSTIIAAQSVATNGRGVPVLSRWHPSSPSTTIDYDAEWKAFVRETLTVHEQKPEHPFWSAARTPTTTTVVPVVFTLEMLVDYFFDEADREWALRVAFCESSAQPDDLVSTAVHHRSGAAGWFQHLPKFWEERTEAAGVPGADIMDPISQVRVAAYLLYDTPQGTGHWYPSKSCWG